MRFRSLYSSALLPLLLVAAAGPLSAQSDLNVPANTNLTVNESASYQNVTVGTSATLETIDANSGGAGDHAITITFAAGGPGTIQNDGFINLTGNDQGNTTVFANPITLSGSGTLELLNINAHVQGPGTLTQAAGHTLIGGGGAIGSTGPTFSAPLVNYGLVTTNNIGIVLNGTPLVNNGTFSASHGAALYLDAPALDNTNGTITAAANSFVILNGITIAGGTLSSVNDTGSDFDNGGLFRNDSSAGLTNVTLAAGSAFLVGNPLTIAGTLTNNGYFQINGFNDNTRLTGALTVASDATLAGTGTVRLAAGEIDATNSATLTVAAGANIYGGSGTINASLINNGTVESVYQALTVNSPTFTNNGLLSATNGSTLDLNGPALDNTNGTITVGDANSVVIIENGIVVTGGVLQSTVPATVGNDYGVFRLQGGATLANLTLATNAGVKVENTGALAGIITNDGFLLVPGNFTLNLAGNVTLAGSGTLHLGGHLEGANNATLTIDPGQILQLEGNANTSGVPDTIDASVVNNGTLAGVYQSGLINSPVFTNNGLLAANNNATVSVAGSTNFTNYHAGTQTLTGGNYSVTDTGNGATLDFGGRSVLVNAATIVLSGANPSFNALTGLTNNEGSLSLLALEQFTTSAALTNAGAISLDAGTTLHVGAAFTSGESSTLAVTLGGTQSSGAQSPGVLQIGGAATVGGTLALSFATGAALPANSDTLTVVSAGSPVQGSFGNVPSGARLTTTDGQGSFRVSYGAAANTVTLSDFLLPGQADTLPTATLSAVVPFVGADSGQEGEFMLTLSSAPSTDVVVSFTIKGTAINGTDYVVLKDTKKIKAGKTSKPIYIIPQGNLDGASKRTVVLTLLPGSGYQVGTTGKVKVKITD